jgi:hypothetical protein
MEGTALERSVAAPRIRAAGCAYSVATRADEPALRELLGSNSLGGWIQLAFQREPDAFAATFGLAHSHDFIIAYEESTGRPVGLCERFVRDAYVNGEIARLPYLGSLRVNADFRNRIRILRAGFITVRDLLGDSRDLPFALTAITADNDIARRVLCAGISGFPQYVPAGEMSTFAIRTRRTQRDPRVEIAKDADLPSIGRFLRDTYRAYQFAPVWSDADLARLAAEGTLPASAYLVSRRGGRIVACVALWDQSAVKQTRVCGYSRPVAIARPIINALAPLIRAPRLPRVGSTLKQVYLSHLAVAGESATELTALLRASLSLARERGFDIAVVGMAARHPLIDVVRQGWKTREYRSLLHLVQWPGGGAHVHDASRIPHPEVALM